MVGNSDVLVPDRDGATDAIAPSVFVIDDHATFAESLGGALGSEPSIGPVAWSTEASDLRSAADRSVDVVIVDLRMPDVSGFDLIAELQERRRRPKIVALSIVGDRRSIISAFSAGADGFLGKHEPVDAIVRAVHDVVAGAAPISSTSFSVLLPLVIAAERPQVDPR